MVKRKKPAKKKYDLRHSPAHAGVRWHQGYAFDKLRYTVLTSSQLSEPMRETVQATLQTITSGPEAMTLPTSDNGWACEQISNGYRNCLVLKYKGIEVALFYKRQLTEIEPQSESPGYHPEGVLQDPIEAWQRLDLLGPSAKKQNLVLKSLHDRLLEENKLLTSRVDSLDSLTEMYVGEIQVLAGTVESLKNKLKAVQPTQPSSKPQTTVKTRQNANTTRSRQRANPKKARKR